MIPSIRFLLPLAVSTLLLAAPPRLRKAESRPVNESVAEDPGMLKFLVPYRDELKASFDKPLVEAPQPIFRGRGGEENLLGYWVADVMRLRGSALLGRNIRFAITNQGGLRANLRAGTVKVGDIYELMPFENELVVLELTGAEVVQAVKEGLNRRGGEPVSGVKIRVEGTPEKATLTVTWPDGSPVLPDEMVGVATTDYLYGGGDSIPTLKLGRKPYSTGIPLRQLLLDALGELQKESKPLLAPGGGRYVFSSPEVRDALRARKLAL